MPPLPQRLAILTFLGASMTLLGAVANRHLDPLPPDLSMASEVMLALAWSVVLAACVLAFSWSVGVVIETLWLGSAGVGSERLATALAMLGVSALAACLAWPAERQRQQADDWYATPSQLRQLADDALAKSRPEVLIAVARHRNTPLDVVETLASSELEVLDQRRWNLMALVGGPGSPYTVRRLATGRLAFERASSAIDRNASDAHLARDVVTDGDGDLFRAGL